MPIYLRDHMRGKDGADIDDLIYDHEEDERKLNPVPDPRELDYLMQGSGPDGGRKPIGKVEKFFSRINVVAINLFADLKVGDAIELEGDGGIIELVVSSMQINRENVSEAHEGDSVGIKTDSAIREGSSVYLSAVS